MKRIRFLMVISIVVVCITAAPWGMASNLDSGDRIYRGTSDTTVISWSKGDTDDESGIEGYAGPYFVWSFWGTDFITSFGDTANKVYGVKGVVHSTNANSSGIMGESAGPAGYGVYSKGNSKVEGNLDVTGAIKSPGTANLALNADNVAASSEYNGSYSKNKIKDGIYGRWDVGEWASLHGGEGGGNLPQWIQLEWLAAINCNKIVIHPRVNRFDQINDAWLQVVRQDGTATDIHLGQFSNGGASREVHLVAPEGTNVVAVKVLITEVSPSTLNIGLAEIEVYRDYNIW